MEVEGVRYACGAEGIDLHCITLRGWLSPKDLRSTAPFLVSARPLSFEWRGRDLVNSMRFQPAGDLAVVL